MHVIRKYSRTHKKHIQTRALRKTVSLLGINYIGKRAEFNLRS